MPPDPHALTRGGAPLGLSVWLCAQRPAWAQRRGRYVAGSGGHPARTLPTVAEHAIKAYTAPGDLVIDPLAGIGTTLVEATHLDRDAIGIEYEPEWTALAAANLRHATGQGATGRGIVVAGDATRLPDLLPSRLWGRAAMVFTSPPYGRTIHGRVEHRQGPLVRFADQYGEPDQTNLAHRGLRGIRDGLATILTGCLPLLRPSGVVVVTARPWRRAGLLVDLPGAVVDAALAAGLTPAERCVALLAAAHDGRLMPRHSFWQLASLRKARARGQPLLLIAHEDVLVYRTQPPST